MTKNNTYPKRFLAAIIAVLMLCALLPVTVSARDYTGHWAQDSIERAVEMGWFIDENNTRPNASITRAEFVTMINRMKGYSGTANLSAFPDVSEGDWYYAEFAKAVANGYIQGADGKLNPNDSITRNEAITILVRISGTAASENSAEYLKNVADADKIPDWAIPYAGTAVAAGLAAGSDGNFNGTSNMTRAETATVLERVYDGVRTYGFEGTYTGDAKSVIVLSHGITLKDMDIAGDLTIAESVGDGDAVLDNVKVGGKLNINGGGSNSIIIIGGNIAEMVVTKNAVHIVMSDGTVVTHMTVGGESPSIEIGSGTTIDNITVQAEGASINMENGASIATVTIEATGTAITGGGTINNANVKAADVKIEQKPANTSVDNGVTANVGGKDVTGTPSGGNGGNGGNGGYTPIIPPPVYEAQIVKATGTASYTTFASALAAVQPDETIKLLRNIGADGDTTVFTVEDEGVTITGAYTVYGSFVVKADGVTFDGVTIKNKGSESNTAQKAAIYYYGNDITIVNCTIGVMSSPEGIANGVVLYPTTGVNESVDYTISGNTFIGQTPLYNDGVQTWSSAGLQIVSLGTVRAFLYGDGTTKSGTITTFEDDIEIIENNVFQDCLSDYTRSDYSGWSSGADPYIVCTSNSTTPNFRLEYAKAGSKHYVSGTVSRPDSESYGDAVVGADSELIIMDGASLTLEDGVNLTVAGTLTNNGTLNIAEGASLTVDGTLEDNGTFVVNGTLDGTGAYPAALIGTTYYPTVQTAIDAAEGSGATIKVLSTAKDTAAPMVIEAGGTGNLTIEDTRASKDSFTVGLRIYRSNVTVSGLSFDVNDNAKMIQRGGADGNRACLAIEKDTADITIDNVNITVGAGATLCKDGAIVVADDNSVSETLDSIIIQNTTVEMLDGTAGNAIFVGMPVMIADCTFIGSPGKVPMVVQNIKKDNDYYKDTITNNTFIRSGEVESDVMILLGSSWSAARLPGWSGFGTAGTTVSFDGTPEDGFAKFIISLVEENASIAGVSIKRLGGTPGPFQLGERYDRDYAIEILVAATQTWSAID